LFKEGFLHPTKTALCGSVSRLLITMWYWLVYPPDAAADKEDPQKFLYVVKGPNSAQQKKIFYVYGRSLDTQDGQRTHPTANLATQADPAWPQRRHPNDVYYNLTFIPNGNCIALLYPRHLCFTIIYVTCRLPPTNKYAVLMFWILNFTWL